MTKTGYEAYTGATRRIAKAGKVHVLRKARTLHTEALRRAHGHPTRRTDERQSVVREYHPMRCQGGPAHGRVVNVPFVAGDTGYLRPEVRFYAVREGPTRTSGAEIRAEAWVTLFYYRTVLYRTANRGWWTLEWPDFELSI